MTTSEAVTALSSFMEALTEFFLLLPDFDVLADEGSTNCCGLGCRIGFDWGSLGGPWQVSAEGAGNLAGFPGGRSETGGRACDGSGIGEAALPFLVVSTPTDSDDGGCENSADSEDNEASLRWGDRKLL